MLITKSKKKNTLIKNRKTLKMFNGPAEHDKYFFESFEIILYVLNMYVRTLSYNSQNFSPTPSNHNRCLSVVMAALK